MADNNTDNKTPLPPEEGGSEQKNTQNDDSAHALKVKTEYILSAPHATLAPIPNQNNEESTTSTERENNNNNNNNNNEQHPNQKQKLNRHKKNIKGMNNNKKRPRDDKTAMADKLCHSILIGEPCSFGAKCKYSHDLKEMLNKRLEDIKEIEGGCPVYNTQGFCPYGISCRVGSSHINLATGQNLKKSESELSTTKQKDVMNIIPKGVQVALRKRKYRFECKRHCEVATGRKKKYEKKKGNDTIAEVKEDSNKEEGESKSNDDIKNATTPSVAVGNTEKEKSEVNKQEKEKNITCKESNDTTSKKKPNAPSSSPQPVDLSPYPLKTRKLIDFSNKVYVAPLTTVGNLPFRRIMKKYGADITCGEMAVASNLLQGKNGEWALLKRHPDEDVFGIQIAAGHSDMYTRISEVIEREEDINVDFVDMNLGCPINVICDHGAGAKLMLRETKLKDSIMGMSKVLSCPITVKIRTGWDENKPFAHKLVPKIQKWGIDGVGAIMLHGRSRLQRYHKLADWEYIQEVANSQSSEETRIPMIGNGDIFSYTDYEQHVLGREGLSPTAMIGRGALIKPWLPTEIKEKRHWDISASERLDILKEFVKFGLEHWGSDQQGINNTRRFLLEWLSFLYRYIPVGMLEVLPQSMNKRPPNHMCGRNDLETLMLSKNCADWIKISELVLGPVPDGFKFEPKHKANSYK